MNNLQPTKTGQAASQPLSFLRHLPDLSVAADACLLAVLAVSIGYAVYVGRQGAGESVVPKGLPDLVASLGHKELPVATFHLKPFTDYEREITRRELFGFNTRGASMPQAAVGAPVVAETAPVFYRNLQLRGVVIDGKSQAIVQDATTRQSFFVHKGDRLKDALVQDITADKVVLEYGGQLIEIRQQQKQQNEQPVPVIRH